MKLLNDYLTLQKELHDYFGYVEDWRILPIVDDTEYYWGLPEGDEAEVRFADTLEQLEDEDTGDYYVNSIYTQRHLPKWVYRGEDYTMICADTHTDGNKLLQIFSNNKEVKL